MNELAGSIVLSIRIALGTYFLVSGSAKLLTGKRAFETALKEYPLVPPRLRPVLREAVPAAELAVGLGLWIGYFTSHASAALLGLLVLFTGAVSFSLVLGRRHACGCLGDAVRRPVSWQLALQNAALAALALIVASNPSPQAELPLP